MRVGEVFVNVPNDEAEQYVDQQKDEMSKQLAALTAEQAQIIEQMAALKTVLYGKFGNSINLETTEDDD